MRKEKKLMSIESRTKRRLVSAFVVAGLVLGAAVLVVGIAPGVKACITSSGCGFLTGGGWIVYNGNKATFGVGGGCKHGSPTWGHLEYHDHGTGLNVHWTRRPISPPVPGRSVARPGRTSSEIGRAHV